MFKKRKLIGSDPGLVKEGIYVKNKKNKKAKEKIDQHRSSIQHKTNK